MFVLRNTLDMETKRIVTDFDILQEEELQPDERTLIAAAKEACTTAYAPYSQFCVGAAALLDNGEIFTGSNQENASFTVGTCAERCTLYGAHAHFPHSHVRLLAIAARQAGAAGFLDDPITPCGACRQAILETEQQQAEPITLLLYGTRRIYRLRNAESLLPLHFDGSALV